MKKLKWIDFDECIYSISMRCKNKKFEGVYGFPRGGLCLAVAPVSYTHLTLPTIYSV